MKSIGRQKSVEAVASTLFVDLTPNFARTQQDFDFIVAGQFSLRTLIFISPMHFKPIFVRFDFIQPINDDTN